MSKSTADLIEYIILLMGLMVFFVLTVLFRQSAFALKVISFSGAVFYITWGFIHHAIRERVKPGTVLEYIFLGIMVVLLFCLVLGF